MPPARRACTRNWRGRTAVRSATPSCCAPRAATSPPTMPRTRRACWGCPKVRCPQSRASSARSPTRSSPSSAARGGKRGSSSPRSPHRAALRRRRAITSCRRARRSRPAPQAGPPAQHRRRSGRTSRCCCRSPAARQPAPAQFYQYALSPEDEARLAARRILDDHHRRGVALVPAGDWGERVLAAFKQELQAGGGELLGTAVIDASRTDYTGSITDVLRISDSTARYRRLESALGTKLQFEPRRRADIEFIFAAAQPNTERLLRPQLRFHYAGDIPTYATSDAFEPDVRANEELDGLMFPDMPWMLGGDLADAVH